MTKHLPRLSLAVGIAALITTVAEWCCVSGAGSNGVAFAISASLFSFPRYKHYYQSDPEVDRWSRCYRKFSVNASMKRFVKSCPVEIEST